MGIVHLFFELFPVDKITDRLTKGMVYLAIFFSIQICFKLPKFPEELKDNGIYLNKVFFFYTVFFWIAN